MKAIEALRAQLHAQVDAAIDTFMQSSPECETPKFPVWERQEEVVLSQIKYFLDGDHSTLLEEVRDAYDQQLHAEGCVPVAVLAMTLKHDHIFTVDGFTVHDVIFNVCDHMFERGILDIMDDSRGLRVKLI
ncbi:hypothetical protein [Vibrio phage vB_VpaS_AL-2]|nr:hypothetical protein [Vibrio phage vB_VpaS_AL-2]